MSPGCNLVKWWFKFYNTKEPGTEERQRLIMFENTLLTPEMKFMLGIC